MGTPRIRLVLATLVILIAAACAARSPQPPHVWQLRGAVISFNNTTLEVRHKTGRIVTLTLDERTEYMVDESRVSSDSLSRGRRVSVDVESVNNVQRARRVRLFGGDTKQSQH